MLHYLGSMLPLPVMINWGKLELILQKIKFNSCENMEWHCMQFELNCFLIKKKCNANGCKGIENLFSLWCWIKKILKRHRFEKNTFSFLFIWELSKAWLMELFGRDFQNLKLSYLNHVIFIGINKPRSRLNSITLTLCSNHLQPQITSQKIICCCTFWVIHK